MRRVVAVVTVGLALLVIQGGLSALLPVRWVPDLALLVAVGGALVLRPVEGLLLAAAVGYAADLHSGSPTGHHALLRILAFTATRTVSSQFHLKRTLPLVVFTCALSLADALASAGLAALFSGALSPRLTEAPGLLARAAVNAVLAPWVRGLLDLVVELMADKETRRRDVRLDTRRPAL